MRFDESTVKLFKEWISTVQMQDNLIKNLEWKVTNINETNIKFKSNEDDIIIFNLDKYNKKFASINVDIYLSENKLEYVLSSEDPLFYNYIEYEGNHKHRVITMDRRYNQTLASLKEIVREISDMSKAYESLLRIEKYDIDISKIKSDIKLYIKTELYGLCIAFDIFDIEDFISLMCISMPLDNVYSYIYILSDNYIDLCTGVLYEEFMNLSWSDGYEIKYKIIKDCINSTVLNKQIIEI